MARSHWRSCCCSPRWPPCPLPPPKVRPRARRPCSRSLVLTARTRPGGFCCCYAGTSATGDPTSAATFDDASAPLSSCCSCATFRTRACGYCPSEGAPAAPEGATAGSCAAGGEAAPHITCAYNTSTAETVARSAATAVRACLSAHCGSGDGDFPEPPTPGAVDTLTAVGLGLGAVALAASCAVSCWRVGARHRDAAGRVIACSADLGEEQRAGFACATVAALLVLGAALMLTADVHSDIQLGECWRRGVTGNSPLVPARGGQPDCTGSALHLMHARSLASTGCFLSRRQPRRLRRRPGGFRKAE